MHPIPHRAGLYLAVLQLVFTLCWVVYAIYLPQLAAQVGIPRSAVIWLLMLDQIIFTVTDFATGVAADKISRVVGRLGLWVAGITGVSCIAFLALPWIPQGGPNAYPLFLAFTILWAATSSALRAPPLILLGRHAARPAIPWLSSLTMFGYGVAGAVAPYLSVTLRDIDPRGPFFLASLALVLVTLALVSVERMLAKHSGLAGRLAEDRDAERPAVPAMGNAGLFIIAMVVLGLGFQLHFAINSGPLFLRFAKPSDLELLMPVFWVGFNITMLPASLLTRRWGGLAVMGGAGLLGAGAIFAAEVSFRLDMLVAAQFLAGGAWGCILMSALSAALAIGENNAQGRTVGLMFSALALATFVRMAAVAGGLPSDPRFAAFVPWIPVACWALAGALLLKLGVAYLRVTATPRPAKARARS